MTTPRRDTVRPLQSSTLSSWPLTPIDRYALQWVIQGTWIFDTRLDLDALKNGLAHLLERYPILGGRVVGGKRIASSGNGIPVIEETDTTLGVADFDPTRVDATRFGYRFKPALIRLGVAPLMTVKLTHLRDGCVLALCCSHACLDGNGFYSMARNLSRAVAGTAFPTPVFDRRGGPTTLRRRAEVARAARRAGWRRMTTLDLLRYAFARPRLLERVFVAHFSPAALQHCKEALIRESACQRLSINSALVAHIACCLAGSLGLADGDSYSISVAVDQRGRVESLDEDFAGNAVSIVATAPIPARAGRGEVAARVHARLEPMLATSSRELESAASLTVEVVRHRLPYSPIPGQSLFGRRRVSFYTNSFSKFPVYDLDFGSAARPIRPLRAIPHNLGDPILLWPAPPQIGGLELYFSGTLARWLPRMAKDDPWWAQLHRFS